MAAVDGSDSNAHGSIPAGIDGRPPGIEIDGTGIESDGNVLGSPLGMPLGSPLGSPLGRLLGSPPEPAPPIRPVGHTFQVPFSLTTGTFSVPEPAVVVTVVVTVARSPLCFTAPIL